MKNCPYCHKGYSTEITLTVHVPLDFYTGENRTTTGCPHCLTAIGEYEGLSGSPGPAFAYCEPETDRMVAYPIALSALISFGSVGLTMMFGRGTVNGTEFWALCWLLMCAMLYSFAGLFIRDFVDRRGAWLGLASTALPALYVLAAEFRKI